MGGKARRDHQNSGNALGFGAEKDSNLFGLRCKDTSVSLCLYIGGNHENEPQVGFLDGSLSDGFDD